MHQLFNLLISIWLLSYCSFLSYAYWLFTCCLCDDDIIRTLWPFHCVASISGFLMCVHIELFVVLSFFVDRRPICVQHMWLMSFYIAIFSPYASIYWDHRHSHFLEFQSYHHTHSHLSIRIDTKATTTKKKHCINWRYLWHFYLTRYHRADRPVPYWEICSVCLH